MTRDKSYVKRRVDEAWERAYGAQQAAVTDAEYARWGEVLAGLEHSITALNLLD